MDKLFGRVHIQPQHMYAAINQNGNITDVAESVEAVKVKSTNTKQPEIANKIWDMYFATTGWTIVKVQVTEIE
jgi:hypothetical protein